jgi:hypothetical protein
MKFLILKVLQLSDYEGCSQRSMERIFFTINAQFCLPYVRPIKTWVAYLADQRWNPSSRFYIAGETLRDFQLAKR